MSHSERPKPQYGEYASDEDYASALARSGVDPKLVAAPAPPSHNGPQSGAQIDSRSETSPRPLRRDFLDRIATMFMLSFGIVSILGSASNYLNLSNTLQDTVTQLGMGEYHSTALTSGVGIAMLVSQVILWIIAAVWSFRRISRRKLSWWVPLLFGVVSFLVLTILLGVLLSADPSFIPSLSKP